MSRLPRLRPDQVRGLTVAGLRERLTRPDREWARQREVMIACWAYALPKPPLPVPEQRNRPPDPKGM